MSAQMHTPHQTIVAVYDTAAHAELAVQDLLAAKVPASAIERHTQEGTYAGGAGGVPERKSGGFLSNLFGTGDHADASTYGDSLAKGGTVVTVSGIPDAEFESIG